MPANSFQEAQEILTAVFQNWITDYFSVFHYLIFGVVLAVSLFLFERKRQKFTGVKLHLLRIAGVSFLGCITFSILMLRQFTVHDYYFLDTFFLPVLLVFVVVVSVLPQLSKSKKKWLSAIGLLMICIPLIIQAKNSK